MNLVRRQCTASNLRQSQWSGCARRRSSNERNQCCGDWNALVRQAIDDCGRAALAAVEVAIGGCEPLPLGRPRHVVEVGLGLGLGGRDSRGIARDSASLALAR